MICAQLVSNPELIHQQLNPWNLWPNSQDNPVYSRFFSPSFHTRPRTSLPKGKTDSICLLKAQLQSKLKHEFLELYVLMPLYKVQETHV